MFEQPPLGGADVAVVWAYRHPQALEHAGNARAQFEPAPVHAVAGAIDVAAGNAFVRLHDVKALAPPGRARGAREGPVAPYLADVERVHAQHAARAPAFRLPRNQRHFGAGALERRQRARDETLGAAKCVVALAHDCKPEFHAAWRSSRAAAWTTSTGRNVRHSLTLPPPQPSRPHGRQVCVLVMTRRSTAHGPHSSSPLGPKSATVGVPMAAARCIGIESTPMKRRARAVSAPSSLSVSWPARLSGWLAVRPMIWSMNGVSSGAEVSTTG